NRNVMAILAGVLVAILFSRFLFRAHMPYGLDSIQFVLGASHYDVRIHQPHPPGYFLFVMMGRMLMTVFRDPNLSFVVLNILMSTGTVWIVFCLAREIFGTQPGFASLVLMATSPVAWFHSEVALSNAADGFFVCLLALLCWRNMQSRYDGI